MEDLREQKQEQWIATIGNESYWAISLNKTNLFNEISAKSLYFVNNNLKGKADMDALTILDDDKNMVLLYLENAIQHLLTILARRIPEYITDGQEQSPSVTNDIITFEFFLLVGSNHDNNLLTPLKVACKEFLVKKVLEQWYNADFGSNDEKGNIIHLLQYRRKSAARRVRPLL